MMLNHRCSTSMKRGKEKRETQFGAFKPWNQGSGTVERAKYDRQVWYSYQYEFCKSNMVTCSIQLVEIEQEKTLQNLTCKLFK